MQGSDFSFSSRVRQVARDQLPGNFQFPPACCRNFCKAKVSGALSEKSAPVGRGAQISNLTVRVRPLAGLESFIDSNLSAFMPPATILLAKLGFFNGQNRSSFRSFGRLRFFMAGLSADDTLVFNVRLNAQATITIDFSSTGVFCFKGQKNVHQLYH